MHYLLKYGMISLYNDENEKTFKYMPETDILRYFLQQIWVSWGVIFVGFGWHPVTLQAKI